MNTSFRPGDLVYWWKRIDHLIEFPYLATVLEVSPKRVTIAVEDPNDDAKRILRHVPAARLQSIARYFEKAADQGPAILEPTAFWGRFTRFVEIGEDLRAVRQVDIFPNGNLLSYDRVHWTDDYGMLGDLTLRRSRKQGPWGQSEEIEADEFERVWKAARTSPLWRKQKATALMRIMGALPIWFTIRGWRPPGQTKRRT